MTTTISRIRYTILAAEIEALYPDRPAIVGEYALALESDLAVTYPSARIDVDVVRNTTGAGPAPVIMATDDDGDECPTDSVEEMRLDDLANRTLERVGERVGER